MKMKDHESYKFCLNERLWVISAMLYNITIYLHAYKKWLAIMNWKKLYYESHIRLYGYNNIFILQNTLTCMTSYLCFSTKQFNYCHFFIENLAVTSTLGTTNTEKHTGTEFSILTHLTRTFLNRSCPFSIVFFVCWSCCPSVGNHLQSYFVHQNYSANFNLK